MKEKPENPWTFPALTDAAIAGAEGMTLRDYFAGQALAGLLANSSSPGWEWATLAQGCFFAADAMLAARAKSEPGP